LPELVAMVDSLEVELQHGEHSEANRAWLVQCGLTPEQIQNQMEPEYTPQRKIHLYYCNHRSLPLALVNAEGKADWSAEYDAWGNVLSENNPHKLDQLIHLPSQQYDKETGLCYNRHRYYDPQQGRYISQDPIGLEDGWNLYSYTSNPVMIIDPLGLEGYWGCVGETASVGALGGATIGAMSGAVSGGVAAGGTCAVSGAGTIFTPGCATVGIAAGGWAGGKAGFGIGGVAGAFYGMLTCSSSNRIDKCSEERAACLNLCSRAAKDPDYRNIYGGSQGKCMAGCLSAECGGNGVS
jgi:RHS repeat-associated protein